MEVTDQASRAESARRSYRKMHGQVDPAVGAGPANAAAVGQDLRPLRTSRTRQLLKHRRRSARVRGRSRRILWVPMTPSTTPTDKTALRAESQPQEVRGSGLPTRDRRDQNDVTLEA